MIEVKIPMEIEEYQGKVLMGMSVRQLLFAGIAVTCATPTFLLLKNINQDLAVYAAMAVALPAALLGFVKKDGYTFDKYFKIWIKANFNKAERTYLTDTEKADIPLEILEYRKAKLEVDREELIGEEENKVESTKSIDKKTERNKRKVRKTTKREYSLAQVTTQDAKRKRKAALKSIKAARRKLKKGEFKEEEKTEKGGSTEVGTADDKI